MKVKVVDDRLIISKPYGYKDSSLEQIIIDIDVRDLAKALKPYLDSIENCEVCKKCNN